MKTREQAEARALELYPNTHITTVNQLHEVSRAAFLQCYDELLQHKDISKTCGYCVKPSKETQKEILCEMMRKDEESGVYDLNKDDIEELDNSKNHYI